MTGGITWYNPFSKLGPHPKVEQKHRTEWKKCRINPYKDWTPSCFMSIYSRLLVPSSFRKGCPIEIPQVARSWPQVSAYHSATHRCSASKTSPCRSFPAETICDSSRAEKPPKKHEGVSENSVPLKPMVDDHYPISLGIYPTFSDKPMNRRFLWGFSAQGQEKHLRVCLYCTVL